MKLVVTCIGPEENLARYPPKKFRLLPIQNDGGDLVEDATGVLLGYSNFPNENPSAEAFALLHRLEKAEGRVTTLGKAVEATVTRRLPRAMLAALVLESVLRISRKTLPVSINRAIALVADDFKDERRTEWTMEGEGGSLIVKKTAFPSDPVDIRKSFQFYRDACPLFLASMALPRGKAAGDDLERSRQILKAARCFVHEAERALPTLTWNPWLASPELGLKYVVLDPLSAEEVDVLRSYRAGGD